MDILKAANTTVVVSHFKEDIQWVEKIRSLGFNAIIYSKCSPDNPFNIPINKGQEATVYLKYIIDFYNQLSDYTIFLHGHEKSYHTDGSIVDIIKENIGKSNPYFNLNNFILGNILKDNLINNVLEWYGKYLEPEIGHHSLYGDWTSGHKGCAQFIVHKSIIHTRHKSFYEKLYEWLISTDLPNAVSSRYMEWTWHLFWNQVQKKTISIERAIKIEGWMSETELKWLAHSSANLKENALVIECGSWHGRSSRAIADNLPKNSILYCVDTWQGSKTEQNTNHVSAKMMDGDHAFNEFQKNNFDLIQSGKIVPFRMSSENASKLFKQKNIKADIIFIDAEHTYDVVKKDIQWWSPLVKEKYGILCGHDYKTWEGVTRAVNELLPNVKNDLKTSGTILHVGDTPKTLKGAVIVETRLLSNLLDVINNHFNYLDKDWGFTFFGSKENEGFIKSNFHKCNFIDLGEEAIGFNLDKYNLLLTRKEFWEQIPYEKILIFQHDSKLLRTGIDEFLKWDYVGAPWKWHENNKNIVGGNGGLSIRSKSKIIDVINSNPYNPQKDDKNDAQKGEDFYFCKNLPLVGGNIAPNEIAKKFSVESIYYPNPLGIHAPEKYLTTEQINLLMTTKPISPVSGEISKLKKLKTVIDEFQLPIHIVFDLGARDLNESIFFSDTYPNSQVHTFECNPDMMEICYSKSKNFPNIHINKKAINIYDGECDFYKVNSELTKIKDNVPDFIKRDGNPGASSLYKTKSDIYVNEKVTVECIRLDTYMNNNNIGNIDLLWMDIQGAELIALKSLGDKIKTVKVIHTEITRGNAEYENQAMFNEVHKYLIDNGFILYSLDKMDAIYINDSNSSSQKLKNAKVTYNTTLPLEGFNPKVTIKENANNSYFVIFIDRKIGSIIASGLVSSNGWISAKRQWYTDWRINIYKGGEKVYTEDFNPLGKNVFIKIDARALGDNLAWIPYVEEFRIKHKCNVICSTFFNDLFKKEYEKLNFVPPDTHISKWNGQEIYAQYYVGTVKPDNIIYSPRPYGKIPLQETATDILGLEYKELTAKITNPKVNKTKTVCISEHGSDDIKKWDSDGRNWQEIVDYLVTEGYEVKVISKEPTQLKYITNKTGNFPLSERIKDLCEAEFFIGVSSGLSWLAHSCETYVFIVSDHTPSNHEFSTNCTRIYSDKCRKLVINNIKSNQVIESILEVKGKISS